MQGGSGSVEGPAAESDGQGVESSSSAGGFWQTHTTGTASTSDALDSRASEAPAAGGLMQTGSAHAGRREAALRQQQQQQQQMLYIQMEFCPRTLRQVLDEGPLDAEDCWQVLAQRPCSPLPRLLHACTPTDAQPPVSNALVLCRSCGSCWRAWRTSMVRASSIG